MVYDVFDHKGYSLMKEKWHEGGDPCTTCLMSNSTSLSLVGVVPKLNCISQGCYYKVS